MSKLLISVTETKFRQLTHKTPITKFINTSTIISSEANGSACTIFTEGNYLPEQREVSQTKAAIDALTTGGYVDFVIPLNVKTINGKSQVGAKSFRASQIKQIYADPQDANDSVVELRVKGGANNVLYVVDETMAAIALLIPAFSSSGSAFSTDSAITATGVDDTDGYQITKDLNVISGGAANTGVELPTATGGQTITIMNVTGSVKKIYASTGDQIDDKTVTTGFILLQPEQVVVLRSINTTNWQSDFESGGAYAVVYTDTISEITAGNGVVVDSVTLKDGLVKTDVGAVGTPAVQVGSTDTGLYQVSAVQTGFSQDGVLVALFDGQGMKIDSVRAGVQVGTTPVGTVSIAEYGDGRDFTTVLTLTNFVVGALAGAAANLGVGNIVYAYPAGQHLELVSSFSALTLSAAGTVVATDTGLGSVVATGAVAVLSGTSTFEDRLTGQAVNTDAGGLGTVSVLKAATAGIGTGISLNGTGDVKNVFLNSAGAWNVDNTGNLTASGTIVLKWTKMS